MPIPDEKIERMREFLRGRPDGLLAGELRSGADPQEQILGEGLSEYREFLSLSDGARFGAIDLWSLGEIPVRQYRVRDRSPVVVEVGQLLYEPLVIDENGKTIVLRERDGELVEGRSFRDFSEFLDRCCFGPGYAEVVPDCEEDEWFQALLEADLMEAR